MVSPGFAGTGRRADLRRRGSADGEPELSISFDEPDAEDRRCNERTPTSEPSATTVSSRRPRLFGTDGIRGAFGRAPLDEPTVRIPGGGVGRRALRERRRAAGSPRRRHPRLDAGALPLAGRGAQAPAAPPSLPRRVPTPCVAALDARALGATLRRSSVSASHNPHPDNGIKLIDGEASSGPPPPRSSSRVGSKPAGAPERYRRRRWTRGRKDADAVEGLPSGRLGVEPGRSEPRSPWPASRLPSTPATEPPPLSPGASSRAGGAGLVIHCRSRRPQHQRRLRLDHTLQELIADLVRETGSDLGFAFDGDADRAILADETGGGARRRRHALPVGYGTCDAHGASAPRRAAWSPPRCPTSASRWRCARGRSRWCAATSATAWWSRPCGAKDIELGGEQSGHIVNLSLSTTGDGLLTALAGRGPEAARRAPAVGDAGAASSASRSCSRTSKSATSRTRRPAAVVEASREVERRLGSDGPAGATLLGHRAPGAES